jgi:hypothetical protein
MDLIPNSVFPTASMPDRSNIQSPKEAPERNILWNFALFCTAVKIEGARELNKNWLLR